MLKKLIRLLRGKKQENAPTAPAAKAPAAPAVTAVQEAPAAPAPRPEPRFKLCNGFYWEFDEVSNGMGGYYVANAFLLKEDDPDFCRCIVDGEGMIQNFPGVQEGDWREAAEFPVDSRVRFAFWIYGYKDGKAAVRWLVQPDGRYFEDEDGFGAEHCEEIEMHSYLDEEGRFTEPFSVRE